MMKISLHTLTLLALLLAAGHPLFAQALALAPAQIVQDFKPGVPFEYALTVENKGNQAAELHVQITDFWYNEKNEKVFTAPGSSPRSAANWIQFVPDRFEVPGGGSQKLKAIVTPPVDAKGGYYAVLFVESKPIASDAHTQDGRQIFTNMRLGCLVLLTAKSTETYNVDLYDLRLTPPTDTQALQLTFSVDNKSNTHVFPQAKLAVLNRDRKLVAKAEGDAKRFLPGQKDAMKVEWNGELNPGEYTAVLSLVYAGSHVETRQIAFTIPARTASNQGKNGKE